MHIVAALISSRDLSRQCDVPLAQSDPSRRRSPVPSGIAGLSGYTGGNDPNIGHHIVMK
jgi:hypothetical protein